MGPTAGSNKRGIVCDSPAFLKGDMYLRYVKDRDMYLRYVKDRDMYLRCVKDRDMYLRCVKDRDMYLRYVSRFFSGPAGGLSLRGDCPPSLQLPA